MDCERSVSPCSSPASAACLLASSEGVDDGSGGGLGGGLMRQRSGAYATTARQETLVQMTIARMPRTWDDVGWREQGLQSQEGWQGLASGMMWDGANKY